MSPASFETLASGTPLASSGSVGRDPAYGGTALLGINLNQLAVVGSAVGLWTPIGSGIYFDITNTGGSDLHLQLEDDSGTASGRWCVSISGKKTGVVRWADFNTTCWSPAVGQVYNGTTPVKDIAIRVRGKDTAETLFDFTINSLSIYE